VVAMSVKKTLRIYESIWSCGSITANDESGHLAMRGTVRTATVNGRRPCSA
jgi:hypothetical protein